MADPSLECGILMTIVNQHSHDDSSMTKDDLIDFADGDMDHDDLSEAIDEVVNSYSMLTEWGNYRETRIHLVQETGEIVDHLVEECCENPLWLKPELHHVPTETWEKHDVS